jgi:hypothetical protein
MLSQPVGEGASLRLDAGGRMEQKEKRSQASLGQYRGSNHGGGGSAKRTPEEGLLVPSDVPTA